jgi:hypothetical protein
MSEIKFFIRLQLAIIILTISVINCVPNCSSETEIFMQNDNNSVANASVHLIETVINKISYNDSAIPYNVVPDISNYERGKESWISFYIFAVKF